MTKRNKKIKDIITKVFIVAALSIGGYNVRSAHVQASDSYIRDRVVKLIGAKGGMCTGVQIKAPSGQVYILTAGHCNVLLDSNKKMMAENEQGERREVNLIEEDKAADLMLLTSKVSKFIEIASKEAKSHEKVHAITHGKGHDSYRSDGEMLEDDEAIIPVGYVDTKEQIATCLGTPKYKIFETFFGPVCALDVIESFSTTNVSPGSSGGPLLNDQGQLIGIVSASDGQFSLFVTFLDIQIFLEDK